MARMQGRPAGPNQATRPQQHTGAVVLLHLSAAPAVRRTQETAMMAPAVVAAVVATVEVVAEAVVGVELEAPSQATTATAGAARGVRVVAVRGDPEEPGRGDQEAAGLGALAALEEGARGVLGRMRATTHDALRAQMIAT